ncbi:hypothetical protein [Carnobacterium divergens]|nr:hypothetical protein [Carnobacterium divergens]
MQERGDFQNSSYNIDYVIPLVDGIQNDLVKYEEASEGYLNEDNMES